VELSHRGRRIPPWNDLAHGLHQGLEFAFGPLQVFQPSQGAQSGEGKARHIALNPPDQRGLGRQVLGKERRHRFDAFHRGQGLEPGHKSGQRLQVGGQDEGGEGGPTPQRAGRPHRVQIGILHFEQVGSDGDGARGVQIARPPPG